MTTYGLQKKINNQTQFKANEIEELCIILKIKTLEEKEKNFFCKKLAKWKQKSCKKKSKHPPTKVRVYSKWNLLNIGISYSHYRGFRQFLQGGIAKCRI